MCVVDVNKAVSLSVSTGLSNYFQSLEGLGKKKPFNAIYKLLLPNTQTHKLPAK